MTTTQLIPITLVHHLMKEKMAEKSQGKARTQEKNLPASILLVMKLLLIIRRATHTPSLMKTIPYLRAAVLLIMKLCVALNI